MHTEEKLLLALSLGRSIYGSRRLHEVIPVAVKVAVLTVTTAVMAGILVVGGLYSFYIFLLLQGIGNASAMLVVVLVVLFLVLALLSAIRKRVMQMKGMLKTPVREVTDAFLDGLFAK